MGGCVSTESRCVTEHLSVRIALMNWTVSVAHTNANISVIIKLAASQRASSVTERKTVWTPLTKPTAVSSVFYFTLFSKLICYGATVVLL